MKIITIRRPQDKGIKLLVENELEYEFAKLNFNKNVKIRIRRNKNGK